MRLTKAALATFSFPAGKAEHVLYDDSLSGFGLRMHPGGRKTWFVQYRLGAKQRRMKLGTAENLDADEARKKAKAALAKVALGRDPALETADVRAQAAVTLKACAEDYLTRYAAVRLKPRSLLEVQRHLRKHWKPLAERPLNSITRALVAARLAAIAKDSGPFASNRARAALSSFFSWAIAEGLVDTNPTAGTNKATDEAPRDRVLTDEELRLVWQQAGPGDYGAIVRLLVLTGCRREEVAALAWSELQVATWRIAAERTKNGLPHEVHLAPAAVELLTSLPRRDGRDLVFGSRGPFSGWSKAKAELDARMVEALHQMHGPKARLTPWRLHDIRRTFATGHANLGTPPHVVEALLNHTPPRLVRTYNRGVYIEERRAALTLWAKHVDELVEAKNG